MSLKYEPASVTTTRAQWVRGQLEFNGQRRRVVRVRLHLRLNVFEHEPDFARAELGIPHAVPSQRFQENTRPISDASGPLRLVRVRLRCRANLEHLSQSRPDSGLGLHLALA